MIVLIARVRRVAGVGASARRPRLPVARAHRHRQHAAGTSVEPLRRAPCTRSQRCSRASPWRSASGWPAATLLHRSATLRRALYPLLAASQSMPLVASRRCWSSTSASASRPKLVIIALVCFFPITVGALDGFERGGSRVPADDAHAARVAGRPSFAASSFRRRCRRSSRARGWRPPTPPIAALFAEYAGGSSGLGDTMREATAQFDAPWSARPSSCWRGSRWCCSARSRRPSGSRSLGAEARVRAARALGLALVLLAAACGGGGDSATSAKHVTLALDWVPNPDHVGIYAGDRPRLLRPGRPHGHPAAAVGRRPTRSRWWSRPGRSRRIVRARGVLRPEATSRWWPWPRSCRTALASIIARGSERHPLAGRPARQDDRRRRQRQHRPPSSTRVLATRRRRSRPTCTRRRGFNQVPALLGGQGGRGRRRVPEHRGDAIRAARAAPGRFPYDRYGVPGYDELVIVANADRLRRTPAIGGRCASSSPA